LVFELATNKKGNQIMNEFGLTYAIAGLIVAIFGLVVTIFAYPGPKPSPLNK